MKKLLALLYICIGFAWGTAQGQHLNAPATVCTSTDPTNPRYASVGIANYNGNKTTWTVEKPAGTLAVLGVDFKILYGDYNTASSGGTATAATDNRLMTIEFLKPGIYTIRAKVLNGGSTTSNTTKKITAVDCPMTICKGQNTSMAGFTEDFGQTTTRIPLDPARGTIEYTYQATGNLNDEYYVITNKLQERPEWDASADHTGNSNGAMLVANSAYDPKIFYSRRVNGLCTGAVYNFTAWFRNADGKNVMENACAGGMIYAGVTFNILNAANGAVLQTFNTYDVSAPLQASPVNRGWQQYGGSFKTPAGVSDVIVQIQNNNPGGCGNDIAIDDISFSYCAPFIYSFFDGQMDQLGGEYTMCAGAATNLTSVYAPADYFTNPQYFWQYSDDNLTWTTISGDGDGLTGSNTSILHFAEDALLLQGDPNVITERWFRLMIYENGNTTSCAQPSIPIKVILLPNPKISVAGAQICIGSSATLTACCGYDTYTWDDPAATESDNLTVSPTETTIYTVTGKKDYGSGRTCYRTADAPVIVDDMPVPNLNMSTPATICLGQAVDMSIDPINAGYDILWQPNGETTTSIHDVPTTPGSKAYEVTVTNGTCTVTENKTVNVLDLPDVTIGSIPKSCNSTGKFNIPYTGATNSPDHYDIVAAGANPMPGFTAVMNQPMPASPIQVNYPAGTAPGTYTFNLVLHNTSLTCARTKPFSVTIEAPSTAPTGILADKTQLCVSGSVTLTVQGGSLGTGAVWRWYAGACGGALLGTGPTITTPVINTTTTFYVRAESAGACGNSACASATITVLAQPSTANAGPDQQHCQNSSFLMAGSAVTPSTAQGTWTVVSASVPVANIIIANIHNNNTTVTVPDGATATLAWTISNGVCSPTSDQVVLTNYKNPTVANAGGDQKLCNVTSFTMAGNTPIAGTGTWTRIYGTRGTITSPNSPTTTVTGLVPGDSIVLRWTIANGTCTSSTDDVILVTYATPTTANAGPDQKLCNVTSFTMAANNPAVGKGTWTRVYGTRGTITDPSSRTTTVTGLVPGDSIVLRWTIANGTCTPSTDDVILVTYATPTTANAGSDQKLCNVTSFTMAANNPAVGKGTWTRIYGTRGTITDPNSRTTTVTGLVPGDSIVLRWTIANGNCTPSTDDVILVTYATPTTANAGADQKLCNVTSFTTAANTATVGTGTWTRVYGTRGTITDPNDPTTTVTGLVPGDSIVLRWSIANGTCTPSTDDVILVTYATPTAANAGGDQKLCNVTSFTMAANNPAVGKGTWTRIYGTRGTITDPNSRTTTVTGLVPGDSIVLRWTIANGNCTPSTDDVILVTYATPTVANAGADQKLCNVTSFTTAANTPTVGTGTWTRIYGTRGTITDPNDPTTTVTGLVPGDSIVLRWTIANGTCTPSTDDVILVTYATPTTANAGPDQKLCNVTSFTMAANTATVGTGTWTRVYGTRGSITSPNNPTTTVTGLVPGDSIVLRWTIANGTCTPTTDDVILVTYATPTVANAGGDQKLCNVTSFTMAANSPTVGTGTWTRVYGTSGTITDPTSPTTTVTGLTPGDSIILRWTITNGNCTPSTDDVTLVTYATPTVANAGGDQKQCNVTSFNLAANTPTVGTGSWSVIYGSRTPASLTSANTTITVAPGDSIVLRWTIANGTCTPSTDDVTLVSYAMPTTANAGADQKLCYTTVFTMAANAPTVGTGTWSVVYGTANIADVKNRATAVTLNSGDSVILRWTVTNGNCASSTDEVTLISYESATLAAAGPDQKLCNVNSFTLAANTPSIGTGMWSVVYGDPASVVTPTSPTSQVNVAPGDSLVLRWTITNGVLCPSNSDDVVLVSYKQPTIADAGPDQKLCNVTSFNLAANTPTAGTGSWSVVYGSRTPASLTSANTTITVAPGDSIVLRWTIANGTCTPSTDDVTLVSFKPAAPAAAGPDQKLCNVSSFTLAANAPSVPTASGMWSVIYGIATVNDPTSPTSTVAVAVGDSVVLRWTISNGSCPATTDDVILVTYKQPTVAAAGPDQKLCNVTSFNLAANTPTVGTGRWSVVYGTATFNDATSPAAVATVTPGDSVVLRWTISNGTCTPSTDDVILVSYATPTVANAGADQKLCNVTSFTMAANTAAVGKGTWTRIYGTRGTITSPNSPTTTVTGLVPGDSIVLRWTIANGTCTPTTDDVILVTYATPTVANAGADQKLCNVTSFTMAANTATVGTGTWTRVYGTRGTITSPNSPTTTVTGLVPGDSIVLRWTIANGTCTPSTDDVTLVTYATPTVAAAGPDQKLCNVTSFNLAANTPTVGTGRWSVVYGSRTPASLTNANSAITVAPGDSIVLRWTVSNGTCTPSTDDVTLVSYKSAAPATAGPDQKLCNVTSFTLAANAPSVPTAAGRWSIIYGTATINNPGSPTSTVTVATGDSVVLRWTITNGSCPATTDDVVLVSYQQPTAAVAGPDQKLCNVASFTLAANAPVVGTGRWLVVYGTATFNNPNSPSAIATVAPGDSVVLRWTISNGVCAVSSDDVILVNYKTPAIANAGPDQEQCSNTTGFTMAANAPGVTGATGTWTITSGTAAIADIHSPTTKVTVAAGNVVTLRWTITNGPCAMTFDEVVIANRNPVANNTISADQTVCLTEAPAALTGTAVTGGNGTYTYQWQSSTSGATAGFANIPGANGANYTPGLLSQDTWFRRVVTSGPCASVTSNAVKITVVNKPPVVIFVPGALTVDCKLGMDYTTLFGTPQFSHTPYNNMPLTVTFTDATSINGCTQIFTRTWTATDRCGMTTTASQTITVVDKTAPVFTTQKPADITVSCDAIPAAVNLTATDDCFGNMTITPVETRQDIPGACANNYKLIRTWTATDGCNNSTTLTQTITVQDKTPPVFTSAQPGDTIVNCNAVPTAMPLTAVDNCTPGVITVTATDVRKNIPGATCTDNYQIVRTWIATDECGNKATLVQNITVQDTTRPVFSIPQPANVTVDCDKVPAWPAITATDNCTASIQVMTSEQKFATQTCAGNYRLVRTWKATDNCGNTATMTQTITVQDTTRPVFTVMPPGDTMVNCNAVPPPPNNVMAVDNCGTVKLGRTQVRETIPGACASNYRLIRTWTATDECGNSTVWRQVITVQDTTRPVIAAPPADIVLNCGDAIPAAPTLTATDNCDPSFPKQATMVEDPYVKDLCAGYTITRRWKIADACGNQATEVIQRIVVNACPQPQLDPALPVNCSDNPTFTIKTLNNVENPIYTLVGVVPANAVQVPLSQQSGSFNLNNATQASFVVRNGVTGCVSDTVVYNLQYNTTPMVNLGRDTTICGGNSLILDAGAGNFAYNIRWSTGETTQRINVSTAGTYWVSVTNGICTTTDTIQVTVIPMPLVNIPDASICRGQSLKLDAFVDGGTYLWSNGATTSSILVSTQEQFWVKVVKSGCITIDTVNVTVNPPPDISLNRDTTICPDQSVMLTVNLNNGGNVRWVTGATTNSIVVNEPGQYWVTVTRDNCMVKDTVNVRLQPSINVDLGPNQEICPGSQITVDGTTRDAISYLWDDGDPNPVKNIWETGKYRLAVMDRFCNRVFYDSVNVRVASLPRVELGADTIMCIGETLRLRADGDNIKSVLWNDGSTGPFLDVTKAGTYSVTVFNDCGSSTDQITVDFTQCDPKPTFPNAFSPNGDGRNDYFRPVVRGPMYEYELRIFNRWGELIYLGYDSKKGWDGRYQGQPVTIGTYVWWLTYKKMPNGNPNIIKGEVTVIR